MNIRQSCGDCHDIDQLARSLHFNKSEPAPDPETSDCLSCHLPHKNAFAPNGMLKKTIVEKSAASCMDCHPDVTEEIAQSPHGNADKRSGDHPTCVTCHGGNPHDIKPVASLSRRSKMQLCSSCHSKPDVMERYGLSPDAVSSYEQSFHGKAFIRFGKQNSAVCTDCHGYHAVLDLRKRDGRQLVKVCSQCHRGAGESFAVSGASHLRLRIERSLLLRLEDLFFKALTLGVMLLLLGMVALDLRRKALSRDYIPKSGRAVALLVAASFVCMVAGIAMAVFGIKGAEWTWLAAVGLILSALVAWAAQREPSKKQERLYPRFNLMFRAQHFCLMISFTVLVLTGMPLKFAYVGWSHYLHILFGGFDGARIAHRIAAIILTGTWVWHGFYLLYLWWKAGFSFKSWTMWPTKQDFIDFFQTIKFGFGLCEEPPRYGRFNWKEKFDYFAVYWGMPIMVVSGLVLWFPVYFGNRLTDLGIAAAYIAHSDEALLAFLAILMWHLYNTHFDPDHFPMSHVWYSGVLTESEMEREHPLEKAQLNGATSPSEQHPHNSAPRDQ
ncbi:MAG: cytochrome c3 family protein [Armatimonadota bacterium]|nr:cytochrome c3 family protein [Armatimonadota bacterium]